MSSEALASAPEHRATGLALAVLGPLAVGGIVAARAQVVTPVFSTPAILFGVVAATAPALYIALAATGDAPPLARVARAFGTAFAAFGIALAGLVLPAAFLSLSSTSPATTIVVASVALASAGLLAQRRLAHELARVETGVGSGDELVTTEPGLASSVVFLVWSLATAGIAGRLWVDLVRELAS